MDREIKFRIFDSTNKKMITNNVCFQLALSVDGTTKHIQALQGTTKILSTLKETNL